MSFVIAFNLPLPPFESGRKLEEQSNIDSSTFVRLSFSFVYTPFIRGIKKGEKSQGLPLEQAFLVVPLSRGRILRVSLSFHSSPRIAPRQGKQYSSLLYSLYSLPSGVPRVSAKVDSRRIFFSEVKRTPEDTRASLFYLFYLFSGPRFFSTPSFVTVSR